MAQDAVVRELADPGVYPHRPETVQHVQTHISHIFVAGPYVYTAGARASTPVDRVTCAPQPDLRQSAR